MKPKTIKKVLRQKIDDWLASIGDDAVRSLVAENTIVTGGSIASMLLKESVNDFDVYFRNAETCEAVAKYYVAKFLVKEREDSMNRLISVFNENGRVTIMVKSAGAAGENEGEYKYFEGRPAGEAGAFLDTVIDPEERGEQECEGPGDNGEKYRPVFLSSNAITLSHKIQVVLRFCGDPDEIHSNYDFSHCTNWWSSWDNHLELRPEALVCLLTRELKYQGSKYPLCSIIRTRKFIKRGWNIHAGQYLKMAMQLNELDLTDVNVLRDQLTGVDVAYFFQILDCLEKSPDKINSAYISELVNRIFE